MVLWNDIARFIASNPEREFRIRNPSLTLPPLVGIERFPLPELLPIEEDLPPPPPLKRLGGVPPVQRGPATATATATATAPVVATRPVLAPVPANSRPTATATAATPIASTPKPLETLSYTIDPVILGTELFEPLYLTAPGRTRHQMECEEAQRIEGLVNELYKSQGGRSRGWTKVVLEAMIKPRCASGGDLKELDRAKKPFLWPLVVDDKPMACFLDFLCVAKGIRVAVWFDETRQVVLYPAADHPDTTAPIPLYHVTAKGNPRTGFPTYSAFLNYCDSNKVIIMPPTSILHSLEGLTVPELESVGTKLGMTDVTGTKAIRVAKIAVFKLRQRLTA